MTGTHLQYVVVSRTEVYTPLHTMCATGYMPVCMSVCLCTQCLYMAIGANGTRTEHTSPRMRNRELFPHPLGPQTSTFMPDFTWKYSTAQPQTQQQPLTCPPLHLDPALPSLPRPLTSKLSCLTSTSPFGVTRGTCSNLEREKHWSLEGIQLSAAYTKTEDTILPL